MLKDLTLRVGDFEFAGLAHYDGLKVIRREMGGPPESILLAAVCGDDRLPPMLVAFLKSDKAAGSVMDAVQTALTSRAAVVDLRQCCRDPSDAEAAYMAAESAPQAGGAAVLPGGPTPPADELPPLTEADAPPEVAGAQ